MSQKIDKSNSLFTAVCRDVIRSFPQLLVFAVIYMLVAAIVLTPFSAWFVQLMVSSTGNVAISDTGIVAYLLTPTGALTALCGAVVLGAISLVEISGFLVIIGSRDTETPISAAGALLFIGRRAWQLTSLAGLILLILIGVALPFIGAGLLVYQLLLSGHDIYFYFVEQPPAFVTAVVIGLVLAVVFAVMLVCLYVRWILALPICLLGERTGPQSLKESSRLTSGRRFRLAGIVLAWLVVVSVVGAGIGMCTHLLVEFILGLGGDSQVAVFIGVAVVIAVQILSAGIVSFVGVATHSALLNQLNRRASEQTQTERFLAMEQVSSAKGASWLTRKRFIFAMLIAFVAIAGVAGYTLINQIRTDEHVFVTAHRGSSRDAPENTLAAIKLAIKQKADYAEIDVQTTKDGEVVVFHDADLKRIARPRDSRKIRDLDYATLRKVDVGSWFSPKFANERMPLLKDAIDACRGRMKLNIELKPVDNTDLALAEAVVKIVEKEDFVDQCVLSSFSLKSLLHAKRLNPKIKIGLIAVVTLGDLSRLDVDFLSLSVRRVTPALIRSASANKMQVHVWKIDDPKQMSAMMELGVDNILTDVPDKLRDVIDERSQLSSTERILLAYKHWLER